MQEFRNNSGSLHDRRSSTGFGTADRLSVVERIFDRLGRGVQKEEVLAQGQEGSVGRVSGKAQPVARRRNLAVLPHNSSLDTLSVVESNRSDDEPRGPKP